MSYLVERHVGFSTNRAICFQKTHSYDVRTYNTWQFNSAKTIFAFSCPPQLRRRAKMTRRNFEHWGSWDTMVKHATKYCHQWYNTWKFNSSRTVFAFSCPRQLRSRAKLFVSCCRTNLVHQYTISPYPNLQLPGEIFTCKGEKS